MLTLTKWNLEPQPEQQSDLNPRLFVPKPNQTLAISVYDCTISEDPGKGYCPANQESDRIAVLEEN